MYNKHIELLISTEMDPIMKKKTVKQAPQVIILARVQWKNESKTVYIVRASAPLKDGAYRLLAGGVVDLDGVYYRSVVRFGERYLLYNVSLFNGAVVGCTCQARTECYHRKQIALIEASRPVSLAPAPTTETETTTTEVTAAAVVVGDDIEALVASIEADTSLYARESVPTTFVSKVPTMPRIVQIKPPKTVPLCERGNLNGNRAFSLLKR